MPSWCSVYLFKRKENFTFICHSKSVFTRQLKIFFIVCPWFMENHRLLSNSIFDKTVDTRCSNQGNVVCLGTPRMHHNIDKTLLTSDPNPHGVRTHSLLKREETDQQFARYVRCFCSETETTVSGLRYFRMMKHCGLLSGSETEQAMQEQTLFYTSPGQLQNSLVKKSNVGSCEGRKTARQISLHCCP
jgi:hypothetical protein